MYKIYLTENLVNGKRYVGQHKNDSTEMDDYLGSGLLIKQAIDKHGAGNFRKIILDECRTKKQADVKEREWIEKLNPEYNLSKGGTGGDMITWNSNIDSIKENMSKSRRGKSWEELMGSKTASDDRKKRVRESLRKFWKNNPDKRKTHGARKKHTEEARAKISQKSKEMWESDGFRERYKGASGRKMSPEEIQKRVDSRRGYVHSEEVKNKIGFANSKPQQKVKCPHCNKVGGKSNMVRYHFDNCKQK